MNEVLTFNEWYEANTNWLPDTPDVIEQIWQQAQLNYPYAICDRVMQNEITTSTKNCYDIEDPEKFVEAYGPYIVDAMWDSFSNELNYHAAKWSNHG